MATITFTNPIVQNFVDDLDENIVFKELHQGVDGFGVHYGEIFMDFINPVTGSVDQVQFELCDKYETLRRIFYIIDSNKDKIHEELEMEDLDDLYDFILMEEEESTVK
tara:strand:- start:91 stop:414 length:324 start_codon:yes stop_codon:yes gene_type:complete